MNSTQETNFMNGVELFGAHGSISEVEGIRYWFVAPGKTQAGTSIPETSRLSSLRKQLRTTLEGQSLGDVSTFTISPFVAVFLHLGKYIVIPEDIGDPAVITLEDIVMRDIFGEKKWSIIIDPDHGIVSVS